jgi:hypothetical protein
VETTKGHKIPYSGIVFYNVSRTHNTRSFYCFPLTRDRGEEVRKCNEEWNLYKQIHGRIQNFKIKYGHNQYNFEKLPKDKKKQLVLVIDKFVHELDRITGT